MLPKRWQAWVTILLLISPTIDAIQCYLCQNNTGNCKIGECKGNFCYKTRALYNAGGVQQEYVQKGCASNGKVGCQTINLYSYTKATQCFCQKTLCNGASQLTTTCATIQILTIILAVMK